MAKARQKIKSEATSKVKRTLSVPSDASAMDSSLTQEAARICEFWLEEIESLEDTNFRTMEEARNVVISRVIDRLQVSAKERTGVESFLVALFETDPTLEEELRAALKIKE